MSELLQQIHRELCPEIPIDSIEFTYRLVEEIAKLKAEAAG